MIVVQKCDAYGQSHKLRFNVASRAQRLTL